MNTTEVQMPAAQLKHRYGLIAARIGASFAHRISIEMPLEEPEYSTATKAVGAKTRTRNAKTTAFYAYGINKIDGSHIPVKALPGATVYLEVQDLSRCSEEDLEHLHWLCNHPECRGQKFPSKEELQRAHGKNKDLVEEAEKAPRGQGHAHVYYGVIEIAGRSEKRDDKGKTIQAAAPATIMIVSDEE